uniref:DOCK_N domain-containing protein n=1 Tax=Trichuris muris TaxID=70415 RepID=A0A5S6QJE9_TRIMR
MAWSTVQKQDMLLVAKQNFCPTSTAGPYLPLLLGDVVRAIKCCGEWYYGFLESQPSVCGIFPSAFVAERIPKNELTEVTSVAKTAVEAVNSVVTEWRKICQRDYEQGGLLDIQSVFGMMKEIINWRSQITSLKLSLEEVKKLNYKIALKVDVGNRMLGADLVVRDCFGNELQADNCSVTELHKYHLATVERIAAEMVSDALNKLINLPTYILKNMGNLESVTLIKVLR